MQQEYPGSWVSAHDMTVSTDKFLDQDKNIERYFLPADHIQVGLIVPEFGKKYPHVMPTAEIFIGSQIYLNRLPNGNTRYQSSPFPGASIWTVTQISRLHRPHRIDNHVLRYDLILTREAPEDAYDYLIPQLVDILDGKLSEEAIRSGVRRLASQIPVQKIGLTLKLRATPLATLETVAQRLHLCSALSGQEAAALIGTHQRNLVVYLLLTCFDRLGQQDEFRPFDAFLKTKDPDDKRRRAQVLANYPDASPEIIAGELHTAYLQKYSVKNSFYRFIDEVLSDEQRAALVKSVASFKTPIFGEAEAFVSDELEIKRVVLP